MTFFPNAKTFLSIGPLSIQWYAVCIMTGAFSAYFLSRRYLRKRHYPDEYLSDFFVNVLWVGIIGARLWYCLFYDIAYFLADPIRILQIRSGGLAIHGGVIAGVVYAFYFCRKRNISILRFGDAVLPNILLAQAIGRWGNYINQEAYGQEVSASFFNGPLSFLKEGMHIDGHYYEPMFFYESIANLAGFFLISLLLRKKQNKRGDLIWAYFMWYGVVRFFIEMRRSDALMIGPLKIAQLISIFALLIGILGYVGVFDRFFPRLKATVLFDLDGTLVNTEPAIIASYRHLFVQRGKEAEFTHEKAVSVLGPTLQSKLEEFFPEERVEDVMSEYRSYQDSILAQAANVMPHVEEVLQKLKAEGYSLGVVTARLHDSAENVLKTFRLEGYFDVLIGKDEMKEDKPSPDGIIRALNVAKTNRDEVVYVGDSHTDILSGKNYGAFTVGYFFNEERKELLESAHADVNIADFRELLPAMEEYFSKKTM